MHETGRPVLPLKLVAAGATDIGRGRKHNEDTVLLRPDLHLYVLADGAGGHNAGNVASALATTSIANYFETSEPQYADRPDIDSYGLPTGARRLAIAIQRANRDIIEIAKTSNRHRGMGTTVVAAAVAPTTGLLHVAHVGDSRCYRLRDGHLEQLTQDHSLINDVLELKPDIDDQALGRLPRNVVTRALGMEDPVRVAVRSHQIVPGDKYLLCSDGLTDALEAEQISDILRLPNAPDEIVAILIDLANHAEVTDNIAALVIACDMAAGGALMPRRRAPVAPPPPRRPTMSVVEEHDTSVIDLTPEIMVMGSGAEPELEWSKIHLVPAESASESMLDALDDFVAPLRPPSSAPRGRSGRKVPVRDDE